MMKLNIRLQRGFSLVTAIFLLVVLGGLGTMMVTFFVTQQQSSALDVMGSRAYQASRAGIEWAAYNVAQTPQGSLWTGCTTYAAPTTLFAPGPTQLAAPLSAFTVTLTCSPTSTVEGTSTIFVYDLAASAVSGGVPGNTDYVERVINVKMGR